MSLVLKMFDFIAGVDIHMTFIPTPAGPVPTPLPYPFMAMIFNPMDLISSTTKVNNMAIATSGSDGMLTVPPKAHIPFGTGFTMAPTIGHDQKMFFGCLNTFSDGSFIAAGPFMVMSCNDFGLPLSVSPSKGSWKPQFNRYLPLATSIPIPKGMPVNSNAAIIPDVMTAIKGLAMSFAFSYGLKAIGALASKVGKALRKAQRNFKAKNPNNPISPVLCRMFGDPVDLVRGTVLCHHEDITVNGIIPFTLNRNYNSHSEWNGYFGFGWHSIFDEHIEYDPIRKVHSWMSADGREFELNHFFVGEEMFFVFDKLLFFNSADEGIGYFNYATRTKTLFRACGSNPNYLQLDCIKDEFDNNIQCYYHANGTIHYIRLSDGSKIEIELASDQTIKQVNRELPNGFKRTIATYTYNQQRDLIEIANTIGKSTTIRYKNHLMISKTDRNGYSFYWEYNHYERGAKCVHTYGDQQLLEGYMTYEADRTILLDPNGKQWQYVHKNGVVIQEINPLGHSKKTVYNEFMQTVATIDEIGRPTMYGYDVLGNKVSTQFPDGATILHQYNEELQNTFTKTPDGGAFIWQYNDKHKLVLEVNPRKQIKKFSYNSRGALIKITPSHGNEIDFLFDDTMKIIGTKHGQELNTSYKYNEFGKCILIEYPSGVNEKFEYDELERVVAMQTKDGNLLEFEYDAYQLVETIQDKHHNIQMEYNPLGNLKRRVSAGRSTEFYYDRNNKLTGISNEKKQLYQFFYNSAGKLVKEIGFDGLEKKYIRNEAHDVRTLIGAGGKSTQYEYDGAGRVVQITYQDGTQEFFSYDASGNLVEAVNEFATVQFKRDENGRVLQEIQNDIVLNSSYNVYGLRESLHTSLGATLNFDFADSGMLKGMHAQLADVIWFTNIVNDLQGFELERYLPGELKLSFKRDLNGKPIEQILENSTTNMLHQSYQWQLGNRLLKTTNELNKEATHYMYDTVGNLVGSATKSQHIVRVADEIGNLYEKEDRSDRTYEGGSRLTRKQQTTYQYDEGGKLIRKTEPLGRVWHYHYFENGLLKEVIRPDGNRIRYSYDALGRRLSKSYKDKITKWAWDGMVPVHEWTESNTAKTVDASGNITPPEKTGLTTWIFKEGSMIPIAKIRDGKSFSIICNHLGTPTMMVDEHGNKVWESIQDIYGRAVILQGKIEDCPFRFQGQYADSESGLYYNRYRYYAPEEGIYLCKDPIGIWGGMNPYSYVKDTNQHIDVLGLSSTVLNQNLGGVVGDHNQAHHLIPEEIWKGNQSMFDQVGMNMDEAKNGILLPDNEALRQTSGAGVYHYGSHPQYSAMVSNNVDAIRANHIPGVNDAQIKSELETLQHNLRSNLQAGTVPLSPHAVGCKLG
ncbi:MAG: AHH domain-containing protein [Chitinophagaceae bacterium]|nr:AHH domain-containing protein [Chitinophagaceae bacterium]